MDTLTREKIDRAVIKYGYYTNFVTQQLCPRYAYTIGLSTQGQPECVMAGGAYFEFDQLKLILAASSNAVCEGSRYVNVDDVGSFKLGLVDASWADLLLLGVRDYFRVGDVQAVQIIPSEEHLTIDVPDLSRPWTPTLEPVWKWLVETWPYSIPANSVATTNMSALKGHAVTEAARWEEACWELFSGSGPDTPREELRVAPLATLLSFDKSLDMVVDLAIGRSIWRKDIGAPWVQWD